MSNGPANRLRRSRERILAAAEDEFLQNGFLGTNMDSVADRAGVSKQTFLEVVEAMTGGAARALREDVEEPLDDRPVGEYLLELAVDQLTVVMTPRLMRLRRMVIGEVERFPELGRSLFEHGPRASIERLARAFAHYTRIGQLATPDPVAAATQFNWILMGAPTNAAMLLGDAGIPTRSELERHAEESVRIFLCAYGPGVVVANQRTVSSRSPSG